MIYTLLINSVAVFLAGYLLKGVVVKDFFAAILVAIGLAVLNTFLKPILVFFTLPINLLTLGLFTLVINAFIIVIIDSVMEDFEVENFGWAVLFGIVLSVINGLLFWIF
ncbi:MAG: phage holin family protein [Balneolaceae bacterium]|nr:phage holin family protein [Balneolaceae bacterium]